MSKTNLYNFNFGILFQYYQKLDVKKLIFHTTISINDSENFAIHKNTRNIA